jgi:hypothetical protein
MFDLDPSSVAHSIPQHLSVDALKARLRALVRRYVDARSPQLAQAVVHHSQALYLHPALRDEPEQLVAFCRLARHWRLLAAQCGSLHDGSTAIA